MQNKRKEVEFFDQYAEAQEYNVFSDAANERIVEAFEALARPAPGARMADLGCGSGLFTTMLNDRGFTCVGLDLSQKLLRVGRRLHPSLSVVAGDVEALPFASGCLDVVLLSGIVHHLPDPTLCAREVHRVLRPAGRFVAFDPNRRNPFMYLYRDRSSPFYSRVGVTENERPVLAEQVAATFTKAGFRVWTHYLSGLDYRYVESQLMRRLLPIYNAIDRYLFTRRFMVRFGPLVYTIGEKSP